MQLILKAVLLSLVFAGGRSFAAEALPETKALDWPEEDLSGRMMNGAHRFVENQIAEAKVNRGQFWKYDGISTETRERVVARNREHLKEIIGAVEPRVSPWMERLGDDLSPPLIAETRRYRVFQVRW